MTAAPSALDGISAREPTARLVQQMCDYATVGRNLFWQRQVIFAAALVLASFYYSGYYALVTCGLIIMSEAYDFKVFRHILTARVTNENQAEFMLASIYLGTLFSAGIIAFYAVWISLVQGNDTHFMALFFLFAAALFAAMNNHQILSVLVLRLSIYGVTFLFIPIWDIIRTRADIHSEKWAQLFVSVFVLYFIIDCSRIYLNFYRLTRKQMEDLNNEHEVTKAALRAKSEFLSTMSHELRTPLTAIKASVDMAHSGKLGAVPEKMKSVLGIAQRNCTQLVSLINEVLDLQKIESGKMIFDTAACDMAALLAESVEANRPFAEKFGVIAHFVPSALPAYVIGDRKRLMQVLANMLSNAAKFSPAGSEVQVKLKIHGAKVRVLVIDQGIGLDEQDRDLVFDRFSQLVASDNRKVEGTGLGMNISKQIIDAHGGRIGYYRNAGPGTTFFFELDVIDQKKQAGLADAALPYGAPSIAAE